MEDGISIGETVKVYGEGLSHINSAVILLYNSFGSLLSEQKLQFEIVSDNVVTFETLSDYSTYYIPKAVSMEVVFGLDNSDKHLSTADGKGRIIFNLNEPTIDPLPVLQLYPNPTSNTINIDYLPKEDGKILFSVADFTGNALTEKVILGKAGVTTSCTFDLRDMGLSNGIYFLTVESGTETISRKVVLE